MAESGCIQDVEMQAPGSGSPEEMQAPNSGSEASALVVQPDLAMASTGFDNERIEVLVEVCMKPTSTACPDEIRIAVERMLQKQVKYDQGPVEISEASEPYISQHVESIQICETDANDGHLWFWRANVNVKVYQLSEDGPTEQEEQEKEEGAPEKVPSFQEWWLPAREFQGLWESLIYDGGLKHRLLRYSETALLFSDKGVDPNLVSWNRVILLHGPPGTGKTSLCKALAQKLSIRYSGRYQASQLIEVNAHALFSRWFSESSKLVARLFQSIRESAEGQRVLVFVLIDEVESLAAAREAARSGSEPTDAIRVVNAVLTQLDRLKNLNNVIVLTTSNLTGAIDVAFVDRADIKAFIGLPTVEARYEILRSCIQELQRAQLVAPASGIATLRSYRNTENPESGSLEGALLATAEAAEGLSARLLRKLPFLAYASMASSGQVEPDIFVAAMKQLAEQEISERSK